MQNFQPYINVCSSHLYSSTYLPASSLSNNFDRSSYSVQPKQENALYDYSWLIQEKLHDEQIKGVITPMQNNNSISSGFSRNTLLSTSSLNSHFSSSPSASSKQELYSLSSQSPLSILVDMQMNFANALSLANAEIALKEIKDTNSENARKIVNKIGFIPQSNWEAAEIEKVAVDKSNLLLLNQQKYSRIYQKPYYFQSNSSFSQKGKLSSGECNAQNQDKSTQSSSLFSHSYKAEVMQLQREGKVGETKLSVKEKSVQSKNEIVKGSDLIPTSQLEEFNKKHEFSEYCVEGKKQLKKTTVQAIQRNEKSPQFQDAIDINSMSPSLSISSSLLLSPLLSPSSLPSSSLLFYSDATFVLPSLSPSLPKEAGELGEISRSSVTRAVVDSSSNILKRNYNGNNCRNEEEDPSNACYSKFKNIYGSKNFCTVKMSGDYNRSYYTEKKKFDLALDNIDEVSKSVGFSCTDNIGWKCEEQPKSEKSYAGVLTENRKLDGKASAFEETQRSKTQKQEIKVNNAPFVQELGKPQTALNGKAEDTIHFDLDINSFMSLSYSSPNLSSTSLNCDKIPSSNASTSFSPSFYSLVPFYSVPSCSSSFLFASSARSFRSSLIQPKQTTDCNIPTLSLSHKNDQKLMQEESASISKQSDKINDIKEVYNNINSVKAFSPILETEEVAYGSTIKFLSSSSRRKSDGNYNHDIFLNQSFLSNSGVGNNRMFSNSIDKACSYYNHGNAFPTYKKVAKISSNFNNFWNKPSNVYYSISSSPAYSSSFEMPYFSTELKALSASSFGNQNSTSNALSNNKNFNEYEPSKHIIYYSQNLNSSFVVKANTKLQSPNNKNNNVMSQFISSCCSNDNHFYRNSCNSNNSNYCSSIKNYYYRNNDNNNNDNNNNNNSSRNNNNKNNNVNNACFKKKKSGNAHENLSAETKIIRNMISSKKSANNYAVKTETVQEGARVVEKDKIRQFVFNIPNNEIIDTNDFKLVQAISKGSFGTVYTANWKGKLVAVKTAHGKMTLEAMRSVTREMNAYRNLEHPLIVKYYGVCLDASFLAIVTEFLPGGNLFDLLYENKLNVDSETRLKLARQLCDVCAFLHKEKKYVHRDLKTANLVLDDQRNLKLCDFGKTRKLENSGCLKLEDNGGSPRYMAPECFIEGNYINEKADVWGIACCLIEILGGPIPFEEIHENSGVIQCLLVEKKTPLVPIWFHPLIRNMLHKCFSWNARNRPAAKELCQFLSTLSSKDLDNFGMNTKRVSYS